MVDWLAQSRNLDLQVRDFIDGRWSPVGGAEIIDKFNPRDGALLFDVNAGDVRGADEAVLSARRAFDDGRWREMPLERRKDVLLKLAALILENREELALRECIDVGKPIADAFGFDVPFAAGIIRFCAEAADKASSAVYHCDRANLSYQARRPMGVVAAIVGWNFPLVLAAQKIGPALAAGNSLVLKPSELTSLSAARLAELAVEAGVPEGVFNVVHGAAAVGAALARHDQVDLLSFTGSTATGKQLLVASGQSNMKRLILECGGKAANIVFDDFPDLKATAQAIVRRAFWNQGQVCTASSRLLVQERIKQDLLPLVTEFAAALRPGDPLDPSTQFGPLVSAGHQRKVLRYIESGKAAGAHVVFEGEPHAPIAGGYYTSPVIFDNVAPDHAIAREEIFGPVLSVLTFRDEKEAVEIANSTIYGLSAIVWTKDLGRTHRMSHTLDAGWISVNANANPTSGPVDGALPVGGHKQSGLSIEGGIEGLAAYTKTSSVQIFV